MRKTIIATVLIILSISLTTFAQQKTVVNSASAKKKLLGRHFISLQWIGTDYLGRANVRQSDGIYYLKGEQKSKSGNDYLKIDGIVTEINRYNFKFDGKITIQVSHNNDGKPCVREGDMTFAITKRRKYWRLQEMNNPCESIVDYVDIYFRR